MPHVSLPQGSYGIVSLMLGFPETGRLLGALSEQLLRGPSSLSPAEREIIATQVSVQNECAYCTGMHQATARALLDGASAGSDGAEPAEVTEIAGHSEKLQALLSIAEKVTDDGRSVTPKDIALARAAGADDQAVHDTVLIAAAFCMFNRYVDGLATETPSQEMFDAIGESLAHKGYLGMLSSGGADA